MIEMRYASAEDFSSVKELYLACFDEKPEAAELFFERIYKPENCFIAVERGELIAMLNLLPTKLNGRDARYLYAACTKEEYRGIGIMDGLVKAALSVYAPEICVTLPADDGLYNYYRRFKFKELTVNQANLSRAELEKFAVPYEEDELLVDGYCGIRNRVLKDNFLFWNNNHIGFAFDYNALYGAKIIKSNIGYAIAYENDGLCEVTEFICADENAPKLLGVLLRESGCERFSFRLSPNQKFLPAEPARFAMARYATRYEPDFIYSGLTLE